jgi:hypothetical protein
MARNGISRRKQAPAEASNDPVLIIDEFTAILAVVLFISLLWSAASAAEWGTPEQRRACTPDVFSIAANSSRTPTRRGVESNLKSEARLGAERQRVSSVGFQAPRVFAQFDADPNQGLAYAELEMTPPISFSLKRPPTPEASFTR